MFECVQILMRAGVREYGSMQLVTVRRTNCCFINLALLI